MLLQLAFDRKLLCKNYDDEVSESLELVKIGLKAPIADMICIEA